MYEFDNMLYGKGSRQHLQNMIRNSHQIKFTRAGELNLLT